MHASDNTASPHQSSPPQADGNAASTVLAWMAFLLPAVGVPSEMLLQDTLKSAVLAFGTLIAASVFMWHRRKSTHPVYGHALLAVPMVLMGYALGSMAWSHAYLAGVEVIRWFLLSLLVFLGLNTLRYDHLPKLLWGIHAGVLVASVWAALQFWGSWNVFPQAAVPASSFANRNFFAEYAVAVVPLSVWLLARQHAPRHLVAVALTVAFNLVAILMTGTRSALIALAFVLPCLVLVIARYRTQLPCGQWSRQQAWGVGLVLVLGLAVLGNLPSGNTAILQESKGTTPLQRSVLRTSSMAQATEYTQGSFSVRSTMWLATARMLMANPWTGVGAGAWEVQIPLYQRNDTTLETDYYAHNESLQLLSEYGLVVGGLCLAFLLAYGIKVASSTWHATGPALRDAPLRAFVLTSLLAQGIVSQAGFPWHLAGGGMLLALCLSLLARSDLQHLQMGDQAAAPTYEFGLSTRTRQAVGIGLACCLALASWMSVQAMIAERHIVSAVHLAAKATRAVGQGEAVSPTDHDAMLAHIGKGIAITPHYRRLTALVAEPLTAMGDCANAVWVLESVVRSRPNVVALWAALAKCESQLGHHDRARVALKEVQRIKPDAASTGTLAVRLWADQNDFRQASQMADALLTSGNYDWELTEWAYALAYKTANWTLAIHALELRNARWPEQSADGHLRLGKIYAEPLQDEKRALAEFKAGLAAVPEHQRANFIHQVPDIFKPQM